MFLRGPKRTVTQENPDVPSHAVTRLPNVTGPFNGPFWHPPPLVPLIRPRPQPGSSLDKVKLRLLGILYTQSRVARKG